MSIMKNNTYGRSSNATNAKSLLINFLPDSLYSFSSPDNKIFKKSVIPKATTKRGAAICIK